MVTAFNPRAVLIPTLRSWSSRSSCLVHLLFEEDPPYSKGGILRLSPIQPRAVGSRETAPLSTFYPRRTPLLLEREEFYDYPQSNLEKLVHGKQPLYPPPIRGGPPYSKGGILRLSPIQLREVGPREAVFLPDLLSKEDPP
jgi:hypothetical protein